MIDANRTQKRPEFTNELLGRARAIAYRTLADKSQADDAVQLAVLGIIRHGYPEPYIFKLVRFTALKLNKRHRRQEEFHRDYRPTERTSHEDARRLISEAITEGGQHAVLQMKLDGYTFGEIAEHLDMSSRQVTKSYRRSLDDLCRDAAE